MGTNTVEHPTMKKELSIHEARLQPGQRHNRCPFMYFSLHLCKDSHMKDIMLNDQISIPQLGFGTWQIPLAEAEHSVADALAVGYRHIDTADIYGNHRGVGRGIKSSGLRRSDIFLTTKVWNSDHAPDAVRASTLRFLEELGTEYIDLLLIHWPTGDVPVAETLHAMDELQKEGIVRAVGVSNFTAHHLEDALASGVAIVNNQVEIHPLFNQEALRAACASLGISVTAYSPLGHGADLKDPVILELSEKYRGSPAQIALNWVMAQDMIAIPKSVHPDRIRDNFAASAWTMDEADLARIDALPQGPRTCDPHFNEFDY
jgi:2,5-diketo-D-gluconate reductase A